MSTLWACAKMRANGAALCGPCVAELIARLESRGLSPESRIYSDSDPRALHCWDLATTMWACGRLLHQPGHAELAALSSAAQATLPQMKLRDLVRCCP